MTDETVVQSWFRFLHTIGSPVDLSRPQIISQTPKFLQYAMISDADPSSHPCLRVLPLNFLIAIKGVSNLVDAFLGKFLFDPLRYSFSVGAVVLEISNSHCRSYERAAGFARGRHEKRHPDANFN